MTRPLADYRAYLFDVDGTLLNADRAVAGAAETIAALKRAGKAVRAVTNNSSLGTAQVAERFRGAGLPLADPEVFSALTATAQLIAREQPGARVHVFGNPGLGPEMERFGLQPTEEPSADYVVVGNNYGVTYDRLTRAMRALLGGARFIAINVDRHFVGPDGGLIPGAGVFAAGLERAVGRGPDVVVGKPSVSLLLEATVSVGQDPAACLYVGDNPEADVHGAHAAGMDALLVLSGIAASEADAADHRPEHVLPSVADLARYFGVAGPTPTRARV